MPALRCVIEVPAYREKGERQGAVNIPEVILHVLLAKLAR